MSVVVNRGSVLMYHQYKYFNIRTYIKKNVVHIKFQ